MWIVDVSFVYMYIDSNRSTKEVIFTMSPHHEFESRAYWGALCEKWDQLWGRTVLSLDVLPPDSAEVEEVFEATEVTGNWGLFVAFIMWLKCQPRAFDWYVTLC